MKGIADKDSVTKGTNIYEEEEEQIEAYELITALCIYARVSFKNKIKLLFEVTDVDDDGYINEDEIKKLIFTVHLNFSEEISPVDCKSYTLSQSLACIKAQQILDMIINYVTIFTNKSQGT
jgi:Ca2+-binding EF-hand superfamily protein